MREDGQFLKSFLIFRYKTQDWTMEMFYWTFPLGLDLGTVLSPLHLDQQVCWAALAFIDLLAQLK